MAENKWHLVSTMETRDPLDVFCSFIGFIRDKSENYVYMIKEAIEKGNEMEKENWYRVTVNDGKMEEYTDDKWSELETQNSNDSDDSSWKLPRCTAVWIFGKRGKYNASIYRDLKILEEYADSLWLDDLISALSNSSINSSDFIILASEVRGDISNLRKKIEENSYDEGKIIEIIEGCGVSLYNFFNYEDTYNEFGLRIYRACISRLENYNDSNDF